jgi:hypothetical protein
MENSVISGMIREEIFVDDRPEHNMFIIEVVTRKRIKKRWLIFKEEQINTREIILKHCLFCSIPLI